MLMGGDRLGKVCVEAAVLQAAGLADREEPLDGAVAVIGLGSVARASPHDRVTQRSFRGVVRGRHILDPGERPERVVALQESCAEPGGLRIAATGALFQQLAEFRARGRKVGLQGGQVRYAFSARRDRCDVRIGENTFRGNLHEYDIHFSHDGVTVDVTLDGPGPFMAANIGPHVLW